jgi:hypothetical protein
MFLIQHPMSFLQFHLLGYIPPIIHLGISMQVALHFLQSFPEYLRCNGSTHSTTVETGTLIIGETTDDEARGRWEGGGKRLDDLGKGGLGRDVEIGVAVHFICVFVINLYIYIYLNIHYKEQMHQQ